MLYRLEGLLYLTGKTASLNFGAHIVYGLQFTAEERHARNTNPCYLLNPLHNIWHEQKTLDSRQASRHEVSSNNGCTWCRHESKVTRAPAAAHARLVPGPMLLSHPTWFTSPAMATTAIMPAANPSRPPLGWLYRPNNPPGKIHATEFSTLFHD